MPFRVGPRSHWKSMCQRRFFPANPEPEPEATFPPVKRACGLGVASCRRINAPQQALSTPHETTPRLLDAHGKLKSTCHCSEGSLPCSHRGTRKGVAVVTRPCKPDRCIGSGATLEVAPCRQTLRSAVCPTALQRISAGFLRESALGLADDLAGTRCRPAIPCHSPAHASYAACGCACLDRLPVRFRAIA